MPSISGGLTHFGVDLALDARRLRALHKLLQLAGQAAQTQTECHVVVDAHVGIQRVGLEDHRDISVTRGHIVDPSARRS